MIIMWLGLRCIRVNIVTFLLKVGGFRISATIPVDSLVA